MNELSDKNKPQKLEDIFREGMGEAEVTPSDRLWERIDHKLDTKDATFYKERLIWFQRVAAASVILILFTGGYLFFDYRTTENPQLAIADKSPAEHKPAPHTNKASQVEKINSNKGDEQPKIAADNLSTVERIRVAKAQTKPLDIEYLNNNYNKNKNDRKTVAITKRALETNNLIKVTQLNSTDKEVKAATLALNNEAQAAEESKAESNNLLQENNGQLAVKSWAGLENKAGDQ